LVDQAAISIGFYLDVNEQVLWLLQLHLGLVELMCGTVAPTH